MRILLVLWLCLPGWVNAEIYQWQNADGSQHFSDRQGGWKCRNRSGTDATGCPVANVKKLDIKPGHDFYRVKTVYDGDTVVLEDGRKIRFLGINTPEVQHRDKPADAGGDEAKQWLIDTLKNTKVRLEISAEKTDKYGRTLAHVFTEKKQHINLQLVAAGLAAVSIYPPNLLYVNELVKAQDQAELARLGIWRRSEYAVIPVSRLTKAGHPGWTRLLGKVVNVRTTRKSVYLEFSDTFEARIERKWLDLFPDVNSYLGKTVEVRGWLSKSKGHLSMLIRHPSAIKTNTVF
ncbi:MAG: thermonuclease family protein [Methylobacter sp.]|nr:thermonuclease family protein [Methylobacter sp.]